MRTTAPASGSLGLRRTPHVALALLALASTLAAPAIAIAQPGATPPTTPAPKPATPTTPVTGAPGAPATPATPAGGAVIPAAGPGGAPAPMPPAGADPSQPADPGDLTAVATNGATIDPDQMPTNLRLRRLEQRVQALKERAWRAKARTTQLKEAVLGGGVGAQATLVHVNRMGSSYRLARLVYALDGTQIFARSEESNAELYKTKSFDILTGPISPGSHTLSVVAVYKGHGYGVFKYLTKYTFTVRSSHTFAAAEGKATRVEAIGFEKGGQTTPLDKRPAIDFKVTAGTGEK